MSASPFNVRQRQPLDITSNRALFIAMSEGNIGALRVLMDLAKDPMGLMYILDLDDMGMRGSQVWVAYQYHCKGDLEALKKACQDRDPTMVAAVNAHRGHEVGTPPAVIGGASRS